jgi:hypothetical protein
MSTIAEKVFQVKFNEWINDLDSFENLYKSKLVDYDNFHASVEAGWKKEITIKDYEDTINGLRYAFDNYCKGVIIEMKKTNNQ